MKVVYSSLAWGNKSKYTTPSPQSVHRQHQNLKKISLPRTQEASRKPTPPPLPQLKARPPAQLAANQRTPQATATTHPIPPDRLSTAKAVLVPPRRVREHTLIASSTATPPRARIVPTTTRTSLRAHTTDIEIEVHTIASPLITAGLVVSIAVPTPISATTNLPPPLFIASYARVGIRVVTVAVAVVDVNVPLALPLAVAIVTMAAGFGAAVIRATVGTGTIAVTRIAVGRGTAAVAVATSAIGVLAAEL